MSLNGLIKNTEDIPCSQATIDQGEKQNMYSPLFMMSPMSPGAATEMAKAGESVNVEIHTTSQKPDTSLV